MTKLELGPNIVDEEEHYLGTSKCSKMKGLFGVFVGRTITFNENLIRAIRPHILGTILDGVDYAYLGLLTHVCHSEFYDTLGVPRKTR